MTKLTFDEIEIEVQRMTRQIMYQSHLSSKKWARLRKQKLIDANFTCERCGYSVETHIVEIPIDVHHKTYERFGDERLDDLEVLCRHCHQAHHGRVF